LICSIYANVRSTDPVPSAWSAWSAQALTNGVKLGAQPGICNDDQSFTLLRPLQRRQ
jgi:hypothetical protein